MSTWQSFRENASQLLSDAVDGWRQMVQRASNALTRFHLSGEEREALPRDVVQSTASWGLLPAEVFDDEKRVVVRLEAPGMEGGAFDIRVTDGWLIVRGEKHFERESSDGQYYVLERAYGTFERAIPLPDSVEDGKARAEYKNGVLRVTLPKLRNEKRRRISVRSR